MAERRGWRSRRFVAEIIVLTTVVVTVMLLLNRGSRTDPEGFRLSAQTMVPDHGPIWETEVSCPNDQAPAPVTFSNASALADEIAVYESELVFARIVVTPNNGRVPERVTFDAEWPETAVSASDPLCAFVVADDVGTPGLTWRRTGDRSAEFVVDNPRPYGPTTIEVWLRAAEPSPNSVFSTTLSTSAISDSVVIDRIGGRINIDSRPSTVVTAELTSPMTNVEGNRVEVDVDVPNPLIDTLALDTTVEIEAGDEVRWELLDASDSASCALAESAICTFDSIPGGTTASVRLTAILPPDWSPAAVADCRTIDGRLRIGLCIVAKTSSAGLSSPQQSALLIEANAPIDSPVNVTLDPDPLIVRGGESASVTYTISAIGDSDLGSVQVVGSDCLELTRVEQALDDADSFLEVGEVWQYSCSLDTSSSRTFRFDFVARSESAEAVSTTVEGVLTIINPAMSLTMRLDEAQLEMTVDNVGTDRLTNVSVASQECSSPAAPVGDPAVLVPGESLVFMCEVEDATGSDAVAYALDSSGSAISVRP
jgi:hypothetical protein